MQVKQKISLSREELLELVCLRYGIDQKDITFTRLGSDGMDISIEIQENGVKS